ncbi:hypothetical protein C8R41DRAFT_981764 [Lentinula lateritia]|uniref:Uncharacterized protein n=1 Tax=Lentinula lateritia TaxID=40482 RepID=A0ABQ8VG00_9AGAR|nr:hypothetical protein C8R41DRAFT_981764 [Lentinula lateritia]
MSQSSSSHHSSLKSMVTSIIEGSAEGDMKTIPCSVYPDMNLESPRTQSLAVLNYARLAFQKHHEQKHRILPDSLGSHVVQSIVSFNMFKQIADVAWIPQDEQLDRLLRIEPRFRRYLRLVEPPKRMRLEVGTEGIKDSFSKLLAGEGMLAVIVSLESDPQHKFICFKIPLQSHRSIGTFGFNHHHHLHNGFKPDRVFVIFNFASQGHHPQWLITTSDETLLNRNFALFRFWCRGHDGSADNGWTTIHTLGPATASESNQGDIRDRVRDKRSDGAAHIDAYSDEETSKADDDDIPTPEPSHPSENSFRSMKGSKTLSANSPPRLFRTSNGPTTSTSTAPTHLWVEPRSQNSSTSYNVSQKIQNTTRPSVLHSENFGRRRYHSSTYTSRTTAAAPQFVPPVRPSPEMYHWTHRAQSMTYGPYNYSAAIYPTGFFMYGQPYRSYAD